jgi:hypothetical protein
MTAAAATGGSPAEQQEAARQILLRALGNKTGATQPSSHSSDAQTKAVAVSSKEAPPSKSNAHQSQSKGEALSFLLKEKLQIDDSSAGTQKPVPPATSRNTVTGTSPQFPEPLKRVNPTMIYKSRRDEAIRAQMEEVEIAERAAQAGVADLVIDANAKSNGSGRAALMLAAGIDPPTILARSTSAPVPVSSAHVDEPPAQTNRPPSIGEMLQKAVNEQKGSKNKGKKDSPLEPTIDGTAAAPARTKKTALLMSMLSAPSADLRPVAPPSPAAPSGPNKSKSLLSLLSISPKKLPAAEPESLSTLSDIAIAGNTVLSTSAVVQAKTGASVVSSPSATVPVAVEAAAPIVVVPAVVVAPTVPVVTAPIVSAPAVVAVPATVAVIAPAAVSLNARVTAPVVSIAAPVVVMPSADGQLAPVAASALAVTSSTVILPAPAMSSSTAVTTAEVDAVPSTSATSELESGAEDVDVDIAVDAAAIPAPAAITSSGWSLNALIPSSLLMKRK